jgi:hypothetical protein
MLMSALGARRAGSTAELLLEISNISCKHFTQTHLNT